MIILGIDPGLAIMGYGVIETDGSRHRLVQYGALTTEAKTPMPSRLLSIHTGVEQLLAIYKPDQIAFEELFFAKNVTTGIAVGEARGAALVAAARYTQELYEYTPMQVKQAVTGTGRADKTQSFDVEGWKAQYGDASEGDSWSFRIEMKDGYVIHSQGCGDYPAEWFELVYLYDQLCPFWRCFATRRRAMPIGIVAG